MKIKPVKREEIKDLIKEIWKKFGEETGELLEEEDFYFVVVENEKEIGYMHIKIISGVGYLEDMILKSEFRNKKIGHGLMRFFEEFSKKKKCHKMRIKTCPERMPAAFHLYKKFGFCEEACLKNDYFNKDWIILSKYI